MQRKEKIQLLLISVFILVFFMIVARNRRQSDQSLPLSSGLSLPEEKQNGSEKALYQKLEESSLSLLSPRDPFHKISVPQAPHPETIELKGIFEDQGRFTALINDQIVEGGETIGRFQVKEVRADRVILIDGEKIKELILTAEP